MKTSKKIGLGLLTLGLTLTLAACGGGGNDKTDGSKAAGNDAASSTDDYTAALVTDLGGVDDKSFNQSAWEGLTEWGEENGKEKTKEYQYYQSNSDSEFIPNLNTAIDAGFKTIFGIGFKLQPAIDEVAAANPDTQFVIIDDIIEDKDNVASVIFKDHEASYLAGVAAAKTTKTNKIGFVGGMEGTVIGRFEAGFVAGVASVNPDIKVDVQYAASFGDAAKGKSIAAVMYKSGVDIIFHASGDTGQGVFSEAIDLMATKPENPLWVIGVDRDQDAEGEYADGNVTLTSTLKGVGAALKDIAEKSQAGNFPGGELMTYGLADGGVDLTDGYLTDDVKAEVEKAKEAIIAGDVEVPEAPEKK